MAQVITIWPCLETTEDQRYVTITFTMHYYLYHRSLLVLANVFHIRYQAGNDPEDLHEAIKRYHAALAILPPEHPSYAQCLNDLQRLNDISDPLTDNFELAIDRPNRPTIVPFSKEEPHPPPPGLSPREEHLNSELAVETPQIEPTVPPSPKAPQLQPSGLSGKEEYLKKLTDALTKQSVLERTSKDLEEIIVLYRDAQSFFHFGDPDRPAILTGLGSALYHRYLQEQKSPDLVESVTLFRNALQLYPAGHDRRGKVLNNLGMALYRRYELNRKSSDLHEAISSLEEVLKLVHPEDPRSSVVQRHLTTLFEYQDKQRFSVSKILANVMSTIHSAKPVRG